MKIPQAVCNIGGGGGGGGGEIIISKFVQYTYGKEWVHWSIADPVTTVHFYSVPVPWVPYLSKTFT